MHPIPSGTSGSDEDPGTLGRVLTPDRLWAIPRVGDPEPGAAGDFLVVPVTTHDLDADRAVTRLWRVEVDASRARPLTAPDGSSSEPAVSPDGRWLAFVRRPEGLASGGRGASRGVDRGPTEARPRHPDQPQLYRMPLDGGEAERLTDLPLGAGLPRWFPDGGRIAFLAPVVADAPDPGETAAKLERRSRERVSARVTEDRVYRYWDRWLTDGVVHHLFAVDLNSGALTDLTPGLRGWLPFMDRDGHYDIAPDGGQIAYTAERSTPPHDVMVDGVFVVDLGRDARGTLVAAPPRLLAPHHDGPAFRPAYSSDGRWLAYGVRRQLDFYADRQRIVVYDRLADRHVVVTEDWDVDWASDWRFAPGTSRLAFTAEVAGRRSLFCMDAALAVDDRAARTPTCLARGGWHGAPRPAGSRVFVSLQSLSRPPEVWAYPLDGGDGLQLSRFTAGAMAGVPLGQVRERTMAGADSAPVQVLLVRPPADPTGVAVPVPAEGDRLPLLHLVHGGPHGCFGDQWHWRWNAQVFAAAGYLVSLVNFHGSSGWGEAFTSSILGRWGDQPYRDVLAVTDALIDEGLIDSRRMAAAGGSYGGYLVAWIASQTDRFACLVNHAGVSDFQTQYASDVTQGRSRSLGGEPWDRLDAMDRYNPMRHAAGFRSPMLVIHGERDYRVPFDQGLAVYNVYKAMGLPARLLTFPDEGHWILKPGNSRRWYAEVLAWLHRWMAPADAGASPRPTATGPGRAPDTA